MTQEHRIYQELRELLDKLMRLEDFIGHYDADGHRQNTRYDNLPITEQEDMMSQLFAMKHYAKHLSRRVARAVDPDD